MTMLDLFSIRGKTALVTGGNGGIGSAMAEALAEAGANIVVVQIPGDPSAAAVQAALRTITPPVNVAAYDCDLASEPAILQTVADICDRDGHAIDILVNCAGVGGHRTIADVDAAFRSRLISINMVAPYVVMQEVGKRMIARGQGGKVLNVSSLAGMIATENISVYAGTKGALNQFTSAFANEWAQHNIQVNCICPGYVLTPMTQKHFDHDKGFKDYIISRTPMGRWGEPADFKGVTVFFCSAASDYITGVRMPVDGGSHGR